MAEAKKMNEEVEIVRIDLEPIYKLWPESSAATILRKILENYSFAKITAMVNLYPNARIDIRCDNYLLKEKIKKVIDESIDEHEGDVDVDDIAKKVARVTEADMVVYLYDGYEEAIAFITVEDC